ncbi:MAG: isopentenyl-diphosphate Delta-isomerase [Bacteroidales bacterium]
MEQIQVVLVDESDQEIGFMEKIEAHRKGKLHRAISVFIFNDQNEWLLQQRSFSKYHCPGRWSNACCTHPFPKESYADAANRRMMEEMGFTPDLTELFRFIYRAELDNGLTEHELDTVFIGHSREIPNVNPEEVGSFRYISDQDLAKEIREHPENFTPWFLKMYPEVKKVMDKEL